MSKASGPTDSEKALVDDFIRFQDNLTSCSHLLQAEQKNNQSKMIGANLMRSLFKPEGENQKLITAISGAWSKARNPNGHNIIENDQFENIQKQIQKHQPNKHTPEINNKIKEMGDFLTKYNALNAQHENKTLNRTLNNFAIDSGKYEVKEELAKRTQKQKELDVLIQRHEKSQTNASTPEEKSRQSNIIQGLQDAKKSLAIDPQELTERIAAKNTHRSEMEQARNSIIRLESQSKKIDQHSDEISKILEKLNKSIPDSNKGKEMIAQNKSKQNEIEVKIKDYAKKYDLHEVERDKIANTLKIDSVKDIYNKVLDKVDASSKLQTPKSEPSLSDLTARLSNVTKSLNDTSEQKTSTIALDKPARNEITTSFKEKTRNVDTLKKQTKSDITPKNDESTSERKKSSTRLGG